MSLKPSNRKRLQRRPPISVQSFEKDNECPICTDKFTARDRALKPCHHWICQKCIIASGKDICPFCRRHIQLSDRVRKLMKKARLKHLKQIEEEHRQMAIEFMFELLGQDISPIDEDSLSGYTD